MYLNKHTFRSDFFRKIINTRIKMKYLFTFLLTLFLITNSISQTNVYKGNSSYIGDQICNVSKGKVYKKRSSYIGDITLTIKDSKIYKGNSTYIGDIILHGFQWKSVQRKFYLHRRYYFNLQRWKGL